MNSLLILFTTLSAIFFSGFVQADYDEGNGVSVAFTFSMPPYLEEDNKGGIELDIIQASFRAAGINNIKVHNVHFRRAIELLKSDKINAIVSNQSNGVYSQSLPNISASQPTIHYIDCAITLQSRKLKLNNLKDFYDKRIWAFKSASEVLGEPFFLMTQSNPDYTEDFDQQKQLDMLAMKRIDIAISDRNIFTAKLNASKEYRELKFNFHPIAPSTPRVIRSKNKTLIKRFNKGLSGIRENGEYQRILNKYRLKYSSRCDA